MIIFQITLPYHKVVKYITNLSEELYYFKLHPCFQSCEQRENGGGEESEHT